MKSVRTFLVDVDYVDEDTDDIFNGILHSIKHFPLNTDAAINLEIPKVRGQCTDSG